MQTEINDTFLLSCQRFILVSNERVHYFLSYLNFFNRVCLATLFFLYWLSWKRASRHVTPNLFRDWVIACFGSRIKTFQRWKSSGLGTWLRTPRLNISLTFPEKKNHPKVQRMQRYVEYIANNATDACIVGYCGPLLFLQTNSMFPVVLAKK